MPDPRLRAADDERVATFKEMVRALDARRFDDAHRARRRLYVLGFIVTFKAPRADRGCFR